MSRSYRKNVFYTVYGYKTMSPWKKCVNRTTRRRVKQEIKSCDDYDNLLNRTVKDFSDIWDSPIGVRKIFRPEPYVNSCEVRAYELEMRGTLRLYKFRDGHFLNNCNCEKYKRGYYWKVKRK